MALWFVSERLGVGRQEFMDNMETLDKSHGYLSKLQFFLNNLCIFLIVDSVEVWMRLYLSTQSAEASY